MRLVFSRKGFDSSARRPGRPDASGGVPSPIFPDGSLVSLPIPSPRDRRTYGELVYRGRPLAPVVEALTGGRVGAGDGLHLDPDLRADAVPRPAGWRPAYGQNGAAQAHLDNQGVGAGDLFLFFGWFRAVAETAEGLAYVRGEPDLHVIFGWLQVGEVHRPTRQRGTTPAWAAGHPHVVGADVREDNNALYVAAPRLSLPGLDGAWPGGGVFGRVSPGLILTAPGRSRSIWRLPGWFHPAGRASALSCHARAGAWTAAGEHVLLRSSGRGQEFVLDCGDYPEAGAWVAGLFAGAGVG